MWHLNYVTGGEGRKQGSLSAGYVTSAVLEASQKGFRNVPKCAVQDDPLWDQNVRFESQLCHLLVMCLVYSSVKWGNISTYFIEEF